MLDRIVVPTLPDLPRVRFADGATVPALGLGTWKMGERAARGASEVAALTLGVDLGMTLIDTAEMYGDGGAEEVTARAIRGRRDRVFVVSKVYPHNAGRRSAIAACERSLRRLAIDRLDLYLLHWRGALPLAETVDAFERLHAAGKIARWGVSNFDVPDLQELWALPEGRNCATNQVLYHLAERGPEWALLPWMNERAMPVMAYSPLGQGALLRTRALGVLARRAGVTGAQLALRWLVGRPGVIAIPASTDPEHLRANRAAPAVALDPAMQRALDAAFPPPRAKKPLAIL